MKRLFNDMKLACKDCKGDGFQRNKNNQIIKINDIDQRCICYLPNKYLDANIGYEYWTLNEKNFEGDKEDLKKITKYLDKIDKIKENGRGFYISGPVFGSGKTSLAILFAKKVLETTNYSTLFMPFSELVILNAKYMQNHYSDSFMEEKINYIKNVDFLIIDDLGKEFDNNRDWGRATLNSILRYRVSWKKITVFTSNLEINEVMDIYGGSNYSIINGYSIIIPVKNTSDYRKKKKTSIEYQMNKKEE